MHLTIEQLVQKTKIIKNKKNKTHKKLKNIIIPIKNKKYISSYKHCILGFSCGGLCLVLLALFLLWLPFQLQYICFNIQLCRTSSIEMPIKRINFESRRARVVGDWSGSPFSYFQYLYQQLRSDNEMDSAFRLRFQQAFGFTENMDEHSFNARHPCITVDDIHGEYIKIECEETQIVNDKTPSSRKKAKTLKDNRKRREKLAMDSILSPDRMAEIRHQRASKEKKRQSNPIVRSQKSQKDAARYKAKQTARLSSSSQLPIQIDQIESEFQPERINTCTQIHEIENEFQPTQFYNLNECTSHSQREIQIHGYELRAAADDSWEEFKESLPTLEEDRCLDYVCVQTKENKTIFILNPIAPPESIVDCDDDIPENDMHSTFISLEPFSQPHPNPRGPKTQPKIAAFASISYPNFFADNEINEHYIGPMDCVCRFCGARYWKAEETTAGQYTKCCEKGAIKLPPIQPPPEYVKQLLLGISKDSQLFLNKPIAFNTKVSFASISMNQYEFPKTRGIPSLRIGGNVFHNLGYIYPDPNKQAKFMQCFFHTVYAVLLPYK